MTVRDHLAAARAGGVPFDAAWRRAVDLAVDGRPDADEWNAALQATRGRRWATANPVREVDLPAVVPNEDIRFLEPEEVAAASEAAVTGPYQAIDRALYIAAAMTGLRQGELVALRWRDVDWIAGRVRVRQNHVLGEFGTPKSRRSTRSVPMADAVAGELERLYQASGGPGDDDLVFADPLTAGPLVKAQILRRFRAALAAARLDDTHRFHDLRHTSAPEWRPRASRCARCRSGWATGTSRPPSGTRTMRRARTRPSWWRWRSR
jgi:integrase